MATSRPSSTSVREFVDLSLSLAQVACTFAHSADAPVLRVGACLLLLARAIHCDYRAGRCRGQRTASQRMLRGKFLSSSCSRVGQKVAVSYLCTLNQQLCETRASLCTRKAAIECTLTRMRVGCASPLRLWPTGLTKSDPKPSLIG